MGLNGAGRMMRAQTTFEDVVKTICTTNCAWSGTVRMVNGLVDGLAKRRSAAAFVPDARGNGGGLGRVLRRRRARRYRGPYLRTLADDVASGRLDLEALAAAPREELSDAELEERLLAIAGVGPYAAAHIMMLMGATRASFSTRGRDRRTPSSAGASSPTSRSCAASSATATTPGSPSG